MGPTSQAHTVSPNQTPVLNVPTNIPTPVKFQRARPSPHQTRHCPESNTGRKFLGVLSDLASGSFRAGAADDHEARSHGERRRGRRRWGQPPTRWPVAVCGRGCPPRGHPRRGRELPQLPGHPLLFARRLRLPCKNLSVDFAIWLICFGGFDLIDVVLTSEVVVRFVSGCEEVHGDGGGLLLRL